MGLHAGRISDQDPQEILDVLQPALAGGTEKVPRPALKKHEQVDGSEVLENGSGLAQLQNAALSDAERQLADLQERRAQKRARRNSSTNDRRRSALILALDLRDVSILSAPSDQPLPRTH